MSNITFNFEDDLIKRAKVLAAQNSTSVNSIVKDYLAHVVDSGLQEEDAMNGNMQILFNYSIGKISRMRARRMLGTDDAVLTQMMRAAGLPPPRANLAQEEAMLKEIEGVSL